MISGYSVTGKHATSQSESDPGLALRWSATQLLGPDLPIRRAMTTAVQKACVPSLASIALICASVEALWGQVPSARPTSVALTVVVPPHAPALGAVTDGSAILTGRTSTSLDIETMVGLGDRPASRIEVRLGTAWDAESARVWVRSRDGNYEPVTRDSTVVALDVPLAHALAPSPLHFRVESARPAVLSSLAIPVEYRMTVGTGDEIAIWTFPALIRFDTTR